MLIFSLYCNPSCQHPDFWMDTEEQEELPETDWILDPPSRRYCCWRCCREDVVISLAPLEDPGHHWIKATTRIRMEQRRSGGGISQLFYCPYFFHCWGLAAFRHRGSLPCAAPSPPLPCRSYLWDEKNGFSIPNSSVAGSLQAWRKGKSRHGGGRGSRRGQSPGGFLYAVVQVHLPHTGSPSLPRLWRSSSPAPPTTPTLTIARIPRIHVYFLSNLRASEQHKCSCYCFVGELLVKLRGETSNSSECSRRSSGKRTSGFIKPHLWNIFHLVSSSSDALASILSLFNQLIYTDGLQSLWQHSKIRGPHRVLGLKIRVCPAILIIMWQH